MKTLLNLKKFKHVTSTQISTHEMCCNNCDTVTYMVELQYRVLAPWGPSSISAVAELVIFHYTRSFVRTLSNVYACTITMKAWLS